VDAREYVGKAVQELLCADAVFPEQFWNVRDDAPPVSGERALMWAVFADGIDCYRRNVQAGSAQQRVEFAETECWILATDWDWPFSFVNLCEAFGFDPDGVRDALKRLKTRCGQAHRRQRFRPTALRAA
jgi:hypothetical protein